MSLPSSETLPTNINDLPPARQRHIRRQPRAASPAERGLLLDFLLDQTGPTLNFFLLSLFGSIIFGLSLYFNEPVWLIIGLTAFPLISPVFALALFPHSHKFNHWVKSLVSLSVALLLTFFAGVLAGYLQKAGHLGRLDALRFSAPYWLDLTAVIVSTVFCTLVLIREGQLPRKIGILLTYEILFPVAVAGFGFPLGLNALWPEALLLGLGHLVLAITVAIFSFLIFSFGPTRAAGWIFTFLALLLTGALLLTALAPYLTDLGLPLSFNPSSTPTSINTSTKQPSPTTSAKTALTLTATGITPTRTFTPTINPSPTNTISPSETPSPQPTTFFITVNSLNGLVIRVSADFEAPVVGYANDGDLYEVLNQSISPNGSIWYQVETDTGEFGWLLGSLVNTQTPIP
jgi:hypothetical protein